MRELTGREGAIAQVWELLKEHSVLLAGPRRIGKTELLKHLEGAPRAAHVVMRLDLQGLSSNEEFAARWMEATPPGARAEVATKHAAQEAAKGQLGTTVAPTDPWSRIERALTTTLAWMGPDETLLVLLDEVPWWLDEIDRKSKGEGRVALARLRHLRDKANVRMVLTGSIGLAGLAADLGASAELNDLQRMTLGPLEPAAGRTLFEMQALGSTSDASQRAHDVAGGVPHWILILAQRARAHAAGGAVDDALVDRAVDALLSPDQRDLFQDEAREHLARRYPNDQDAMHELLTRVAASESGVGHEALVSVGLALDQRRTRRQVESLILHLSDAWYVQQRDHTWRFCVPLFQKWWLRYGGR